MLKMLKNLFGSGTPVDYARLRQDGAQIVDVRTKNEYQGGHIQESVNIPLDVLAKNLNRLNKDKPVIVCCASGMRSASAKSILQSSGFEYVYNGGSWTSLQSKL